MSRNRGCEQVCAIYIDAPELADAVDGVVDCFEVFGEAGWGYEVVDFAVLLDDFGDGCVDGFGGGDVGVVGGDFWYTIISISILILNWYWSIGLHTILLQGSPF